MAENLLREVFPDTEIAPQFENQILAMLPAEFELRPGVIAILVFLKSLIQQLGTNLPAILEALKAAGIVLPPWAIVLLPTLIFILGKSEQ